MSKNTAFFISLLFFSCALTAQPTMPVGYNVVWNSQSKNSAESMPCGGGDIGLNVWVENGELLFYIAKSGTFDENNGLLKLGRVRVKLSPNPLAGQTFRQELVLQDGYVRINGSDGKLATEIKVWVDVFRPVIRVEINSDQPVNATAVYESWRHRDRPSVGRENNANSYKWAQLPVTTFKDDISFSGNEVLFYHRNKDTPSIFDITVHQQGMDSVKNEMYNPLKNACFGGMMTGDNMLPAGIDSGKYQDADFHAWKLQSRSASRSQRIAVYLYAAQTNTVEEWQQGLQSVIKAATTSQKTAWQKTKDWWQQFWAKSFVYIQADNGNKDSATWQAGRNYQLFRYMLGCNAFGSYPTKFNGGLFTSDPALTNPEFISTPDFRNWGGGTHTAQNQRLVYFPMIRNGDFDMMKPQFDFYLRILHNAELRSRVNWGHGGACFTEQMENFGLPNCSEYGWWRPAGFDPGLEHNAWLEYEWDTVLEFCLMMLETQRYNGTDISSFIPFIESCVSFFDEHYQYLAAVRGIKKLDDNGKLVLYPGAGAETYKMAYNSSSTIAALQTVAGRLLALPATYLDSSKRSHWQQFLSRIPPISFRYFGEHKTIAPALHWERVNNTEPTQLYPVFPWSIYGVGKPGLEIARNTYLHDTDAIKFRSHVGWKQDNIFSASLGFTNEAARLALLKLQNSGRRFPAFWGPGFDWVPDHNWGGSGMIGVQEMLMQTDDRKIMLFPAWPKAWDVHFKLFAPYNTTVEGELKDGKVVQLKVIPESRRSDVEILLQ